MPTNPIREAFIKNALEFAEQLSRKEGVRRVAIVREITQPVKKPHILCLLVTIGEEAPVKPIADVGRKLTGRMLSMPESVGSDVFLANEQHEYLGRTCNYRECHPRAACRGGQCYGTYICNDFHIFTLEKEVIESPPVEVFPRVVIRDRIPDDLRQALEEYQKRVMPARPMEKEYPGRQNKNAIITDTWSNPSAKDLYDAAWPEEPETRAQYEEGRQCGGCAFYAPFNADWGLCCHSASRHHLETVFEHFTCPKQKEEGWGAHSFSEISL